MVAPRRYETLDALRGIAALAVVIFHLAELRLEPSLIPHGYLAVDFFFVLSGFVIAHAYMSALQECLSCQAFVMKRVIRLYPLALLGATMGSAVLLMKWHSFPNKVDTLPQIVVSISLNSLMLPTWFGGDRSRHELFPGNGPLWSLFFELFINVFWAWLGVRARLRTLILFVLGSASLLAVVSFQAHTENLGFDTGTFIGGLARVCFGFPLGVLLYRLHTSPRADWVRLRALFCGLSVIAVLAFPWNGFVAGMPIADLLSVVILLPLIIAAGATVGPVGSVGRYLGQLSYPVYVTHFPILLVASGLRQTTLSRLNVHILSALSLFLVVAFAYAASRWYDEPSRVWLSRLAKRTGLLGPPQARTISASSGNPV